MTALLVALVLDAMLGEPKWLWDRAPHPAVLMGRAVAWLEGRLNIPPAPRAAGVLSVALLVVAAWIIGWALANGGWLIEAVIAAILLAHRSLVEHVSAVAQALRRSLEDGRKSVGMIVGRDTRAMDEAAVSRAAIESAAENFSDGVIAPAFWFVIAGLPGILIYKVVNTADSMIGYRTERLEQFGWAAARLDDVLNWVPARLTALLIAGVHGCFATAEIAKDAALHRSPNAGWPEAAMARVLNVALAGPRVYDGTREDLAWVHGTGDSASAADIDRACSVLWRAWAAFAGAIAILAVAF